MPFPTRFGNALIDAWMATQGLAQDSKSRTLDRLAYMGKRGMGALEFKPARRIPPREFGAARDEVAGREEASELHRREIFPRITRRMPRSRISCGSAPPPAARAPRRSLPGTRARNMIRSGQFDVASGIRALAAEVRRRRPRSRSWARAPTTAASSTPTT